LQGGAAIPYPCVLAWQGWLAADDPAGYKWVPSK
jgi:hypothetical protein